jgi:hypothetical protein
LQREKDGSEESDVETYKAVREPARAKGSDSGVCRLRSIKVRIEAGRARPTPEDSISKERLSGP